MPVSCPHLCPARSGARCTACGGGPCIHCGGGGGGGQYGRVERSLVMQRGAWERLKRRAGPCALLDAQPAPPMPPPGEAACGCAPSPEEHAKRMREDAQRLRLSMSHAGMKEGLHASLVAQSGHGSCAQAEHEVQQMDAAVAERAAQRKTFIENCRALLCANNIHGVRALDSALRFTEVLRERNAQVCFNAKLRAEACQRQRTWYDHLRQTWAHQDALQAARTRQKECERQAYRAELLKQLEENSNYRLQEKREIERERQELDLMCKEAINGELTKKEMVARRKQELRRMLGETIADQQRHRAQLAAESCEHDRIIAVTRDVQNKIRRTGMCKIKERVQAFMCASDKIGEKIWAAHQNDIKNLQEEDNRIRHLQLRAEKAWIAREQADAQRRANNCAAQRQSFRQFQQEEAARRCAEASERARLTQLREKQTAFVKSLCEQEIAECKRKQREARANYDSQVAEKRQQRCKEHAEEMKMYMAKLNAWKNEDSHFFNYANQLLQDAQCCGRLPLPFNKVIYEYKKIYGLLPRPRRVDTLGTPNCW